MTVKTKSISLNTHGDTDIHDISDQITDVVSRSGLKAGTVTVFCPSSTSGVTTIEFESGALSDLKRMFNEIIPSNREYAHNVRWGDENGFSHIRASLLGPSITIPFVDGHPTFGTWQQVIYVDFDNKPRKRELILQLIGE